MFTFTTQYAKHVLMNEKFKGVLTDLCVYIATICKSDQQSILASL